MTVIDVEQILAWREQSNKEISVHLYLMARKLISDIFVAIMVSFFCRGMRGGFMANFRKKFFFKAWFKNILAKDHWSVSITTQLLDRYVKHIFNKM